MLSLERQELRVHQALGGTTRLALLAELRRAPGPASAQELARRTGLHLSTVRFHLGVLARAGLASPSFDRASRRGRPRQLWTVLAASRSPVADDGGDPHGYQLLAQVLSHHLATASADPEADARAAGETWGRQLVAPPGSGSAPTESVAVARLTVLLDELGFHPEPIETGGARQVHLRRCPFLDLARRTPTVVCAAHLGLMRGALREMGAPLTASRLDPLVEPGRCIAHLDRAAPAPPAA